jgi:hypothetical protein
MKRNSKAGFGHMLCRIIKTTEKTQLKMAHKTEYFEGVMTMHLAEELGLGQPPYRSQRQRTRSIKRRNAMYFVEITSPIESRYEMGFQTGPSGGGAYSPHDDTYCSSSPLGHDLSKDRWLSPLSAPQDPSGEEVGNSSCQYYDNRGCAEETKADESFLDRRQQQDQSGPAHVTTSTKRRGSSLMKNCKKFLQDNIGDPDFDASKSNSDPLSPCKGESKIHALLKKNFLNRRSSLCKVFDYFDSKGDDDEDTSREEARIRELIYKSYKAKESSNIHNLIRNTSDDN